MIIFLDSLILKMSLVQVMTTVSINIAAALDVKKRGPKKKSKQVYYFGISNTDRVIEN